MQIHVLTAALSLCILSLGLFLGGAVRPLLVTATRSEPTLIGPILTRTFSRYNVVALALSALVLTLEIRFTPSLARLLLAGALTAILALKLPFDHQIQQRERSAQIRGVGAKGKQLDLLHRLMEAATIAVLLLSASLFVLDLLAPTTR